MFVEFCAKMCGGDWILGGIVHAAKGGRLARPLVRAHTYARISCFAARETQVCDAGVVQRALYARPSHHRFEGQQLLVPPWGRAQLLAVKSLGSGRLLALAQHSARRLCERSGSPFRASVNPGPLPRIEWALFCEPLCTDLSVKTFRSIIREHTWAEWRVYNARVIQRALSSEVDLRV